MNTIEEIYNNILPEEWEQIQTMAGLFFDAKAICIAMNWDETMLEHIKLSIEIMDINDPFYREYFAGRLTGEIELRQSIKQAAQNGSNPAQNTLLTFLTQTK